MKTALIAVLILGSCCICLAQQINQDTIRWNTIEFTDLNTNVTVTNEIYFVSHGDRIVQWFQNNGKFKIDFTVTNVSGDWLSLAAPGSITFEISDGTSTGSMVFTRTSATDVFVEMHIRGATSDIDLRYKISSYSKL